MNPPPRDSAEEGLRRAYREVQSAGGPGCPSPDTLTALVLDQDVAPGREALADHIVSCRRCAEDYQLLSRTHAEVSRSGKTSLSRRAILSSAAVVLAGAAGLLILGRRGTDTDAVRGSKSNETVEPARGATLAQAPVRLAWPPDPDARSYRVSLFDSSGELVWKSDPLATPVTEIPAEARGRLKPGAYYWSVAVERPVETARLGPYPFRIGLSR